ncbi:hypothetical protein ACFWQG_17105 [Rhodococcus sp. NPDC058532]|uniref:hypothetical protein n=1 Tax=Rhodococcus sp. NPDC058532 TaxID=3346540 RepID=UPI00365290F5
MRVTEPRQSPGPDTSRARWSWRDTAVVAGIVALGFGAASVLPRDHPDTGPAAPTYVTEPVAYPVDIPGCAEVLPPPPPVTGSGWTMYGASYGYGDPDFAWLTAPKATAMTDALRAALPTDADVRFDAPRRMLLFQPIFRMNPDQLPEDVAPEDVSGVSESRGFLVRGEGSGTLRTAVRAGSGTPPDCVAGALDERRTLADGTVVDVLDSWFERGGVRTRTAGATAYTPDGSRVDVSVDDTDGDTHSGALPLTVDELARVAAEPGLRTTTTVPVGTPAARMGCGAAPDGSGAPLDRADVERLNGALDAALVALGPLPATPDRPLGSLELTGAGRTSVCTEVTLSGSGGESRLRVVIAPAPSESRAAGEPRPDGTRVRTHREYGTTHVTATRPSGTAVTVDLGGLGAVPTVDQVIALVTAPGLDLP